MSVTKPAELTMERARDMRAQSLNPQALMEEDEALVDDALFRAKGPETAEERKVNSDTGGRHRGSGEPGEGAEEQPPQEDEATALLKRQAGELLLSLPVDEGKFAPREERRIDIRL
jgi:hypothetical protein